MSADPTAAERKRRQRAREREQLMVQVQVALAERGYFVPRVILAALKVSSLEDVLANLDAFPPGQIWVLDRGV